MMSEDEEKFATAKYNGTVVNTAGDVQPKSERHTKHGAVTAESIRKKFLPGLDESYILLRHQLGKETYQATGEALTAFTAALDTWFKYIDKLFPVKKDQES